MFTKTAGFRHDSIPTAKEVMRELAETHGFELDISEDAAVFSEAVLCPYDVVMFASTTGEVLATEQQGALESFIAAGGGFVGVHAASDTLYSWPWYGELVGAYFSGTCRERAWRPSITKTPATLRPGIWTKPFGCETSDLLRPQPARRRITCC